VATLRLSNRPGRDTATSVEVVVQSVTVNGEEVPLVIAPLMWSQSYGTQQVDVGPGEVFDLSLLRVNRFGDEGTRRATIFYANVNAAAAPFVPTSAELDVLPAGEYAFNLSVRGHNLDARIWTVRAKFDGYWGDELDDIQNHLTVDIPKTPRESWRL
jgi:hypothetical protein